MKRCKGYHYYLELAKICQGWSKLPNAELPIHQYNTENVQQIFDAL